MSLLFVLLVVFVLLFGFVVFFGAPYLPTLGKQQHAALDMLNLSPGQTLLELGCGDGRVVAAAADRGLKAVGIELNPILALIAWARTRKYGVRVKIIWGSFWHEEWPVTDGVYVFLLDKYMKKLDTKIIQKYPGRKVKLVSFAFKIPGKKVTSKSHGLYLYSYGD